MLPAATEAWPAVFGGLIPILGLAAAAYLIYRAAKDDGSNDNSGDDGSNLDEQFHDEARHPGGPGRGTAHLDQKP